ncbi:AtpZ/AtpI family protein [Costertonia aggregata]|uniref:AtpZ/AtpI family protein n=1 Tax=Costertonia aggregata TaxID=343403 RepID=A0A7H9AP51_9FLAO|nr:AtpZ/AtpI family protein [Costertonia aggregata]QLG45210.1 AtpZ/AtpI family protein [Costertonia aggregata]
MEQQKPRKPSKNNGLQTAAKLSGIAIQMGLTIYLGNLLGAWLDEKYHTSFWENTCTLLAVCISLYSVIVQANRLNK